MFSRLARARDIAPDGGRAFAAAADANRSSARGAPRCDDLGHLATWPSSDRDHRTRRNDG